RGARARRRRAGRSPRDHAACCPPAEMPSLGRGILRGGPMARTMDRTQVDQAAIDELAAGFRGEIVRAPDPSYEEHRHVWNGSINRFPGVIARCAGVADGIAA